MTSRGGRCRERARGAEPGERLRTPMRGVLLLAGLLLVLAPRTVESADSPPSAAPAQQALELREAQRVDAQGRVERVSLPDVPGFAAATDAVHQVRYRFDFDAVTRADVSSALYLPGLRSHARIQLNGTVLRDTLAQAGQPAPRSSDAVVLVELPDGLLRDGGNRLDIVLAGVQGVSLSTVWVGPVHALQALRDRKVLLLVIGPLMVATAIGSLGLCVLLLWLRRPQESLYGYFGAGALLWALHSIWTVLPTPLLPPPHQGIWWTALYAALVTPLIVFCLRFSHAVWPRAERAQWLLTLASPALLYAALPWGAEGRVAELLRLELVLAVAVAFGVVLRHAWRVRSVDSLLLAATGLVCGLFGARDWLVAQARDSNPVWLTPYGGLAFIVLVAWLLIDRVLLAAGAQERMNAELEQRVTEKSAALSQALEAMREARDEAQGANRAKSVFLAAVSHDLRQPLHALGLYVAALRALPLVPPQAALAERMERSVLALESMFDALLDLSRIEAGAIEPRPRNWSPQALAHRLGDEVAASAAERGLRLSVRVTPSALNARCDPLLLERILRNLLGNAVKYTQRGGVLLACRVRRGSGAARWRFDVCDTGPGIEPHEQSRVFDEFYRSGEAQGSAPGLGLGLSIVRGLSRALGVEVRMRSLPGRGTRFTLEVAATDAPADDERPATVETQSLAGACVAVIEDDAQVRESLALLLERWGMRVLVAADAETLLGLARDAQPLHAVLADYRLAAGRNGVQAVAALRRQCGEATPALIVTADSAPHRLAEIASAGLPWMTKPVSAARLRAWLAAALAQRAPLTAAQALTEVPP